VKRVKDIVVLAVASDDVAPTLAHEILNLIEHVLSSYGLSSTVAIRENFSVVYQLLEELLDYGFPLTTENHELEELVPPPTIENKVRTLIDAPLKAKTGGFEFGRIPWRDPKVSYASNEIVFDIVESIDAVMDAEGNLSRCSINGHVACRSKLSGTPDVALKFADTELFDDISFHRCVRVAQYESDRSLTFVPPDGKFRLCEFRCKAPLSLKLPFYIAPQVSFNKDGGRVSIMLGVRHGASNLTSEESSVSGLEVRVPLPSVAINVVPSQVGSGTKVSFDANTHSLVWVVGGLDVNTKSVTCEVIFSRPLDKTPPPYGESIAVDFAINTHSVTGVRIASVNVRNETYKLYKGMKNITRAGRFFVRPQ
jgi:AP-3 complex subunit mu